MKKCDSCGSVIEDDSIFCTFCGKKIEYQGKKCPRCGANLEYDSVFCSRCGMKLQKTPVDTPPQETEIQNNKSSLRKFNPLCYALCSIGIFLLLLISIIYSFNYKKKLPSNETSTSLTSSNNEKELSLIGDADGFPLKLDLRVVNGVVTGVYKNVTYGTTMKVSGTMDGDVIYLEGTTDNKNYIFQITHEGENYTGTFGRVGGKKMNLHLKIYPNELGLDEHIILDSMSVRENIFIAYKKALDDIFDCTGYEEGLDIEGFELDYFLFDITNDGIPDLWLKCGTCEADFIIKVCAYDKNQSYKTIWVGNAFHSTFYAGNGYILQSVGHQGYGKLTKLTYDGKRMVETIIEEVDNLGPDGELLEEENKGYKITTEKMIELHSSVSLEPIRHSLGIK